MGHVAKQFATKPSDNVSYYKEFDCSDVFSGLAIETYTDNVDSLRAMDGVINVWPLKSVPLAPIPKKTKIFPGTTRSNYSMHQWTGVDRLHAAGVRGQGATVAIIDTGIDYTHSAVRAQLVLGWAHFTDKRQLGGCFGPGCKVSGGYDLVGPNCKLPPCEDWIAEWLTWSV
jgi:hypothetical protein